MMFVQNLHGINHNKIEDTKEEHHVANFESPASAMVGFQAR